MRTLIGFICLIGTASLAWGLTPIDISCSVDSYGSFDSGDSWTGNARSLDDDPATPDAEGEWVHELADGRTFRGEVELLRCRANGGLIATAVGRGHIYGAPRNTDDPGLGVGHCI